YFSFANAVEAGKMDAKTLENFKNRLAEAYKNYDPELDAKVTAKVLALYANRVKPEFLPAGFDQYKDVNRNLQTIEELPKNSVITGRGTFNGPTAYSGPDKVFADPNALVQNLTNDPLMKLFPAMREN